MPIVFMLISPVRRSCSCTNDARSGWRIYMIKIQAAMCTPIELHRISINSPNANPISISAHRGRVIGNMSRHSRYICGWHKPQNCKLLNSNTCKAITTSHCITTLIWLISKSLQFVICVIINQLHVLNFAEIGVEAHLYSVVGCSLFQFRRFHSGDRYIGREYRR